MKYLSTKVFIISRVHRQQYNKNEVKIVLARYRDRETCFRNGGKIIAKGISYNPCV